MSIQFPCEQCGHTLETPDGSEARQCRCPECQSLMTVPAGSPAVSTGDFAGFSTGAPAVSDRNPPGGLGNPMDSNPYAAPAPTDPIGPGSVGPGSVAPYPPQGVSSKGTTALILGIFSTLLALFSCLCCVLIQPVAIGLGIGATIMAKQELRMIDSGFLSPNSRTEAKTGQVLGITGIALGALGIVVNGGFFVLQILNAP